MNSVIQESAQRGRCSPTTFGVEGFDIEWDVLATDARDPKPSYETHVANDIAMLSMKASRMRGRIRTTGIDRPRNGFCGVLVVMAGAQVARSGGQTHLLYPGDILAWDSSSTGDFEIFEPGERMQLLVPRDRIEALVPGLSRCRAFDRVDGKDPVAMLVRKCFETVWQNRNGMSPLDLLKSIEATLTVLALSLRGKAKCQTRSKDSIYDQVLVYIEKHLDDATLSPANIAKVHGCSLRSLHALFCGRGTTVAGHIRYRRLEQCRRDLVSGLTDPRVSDIAFKWGFTDLSHFSKLFKTSFGVTPKDYRKSVELGPLLPLAARPNIADLWA